MTYPSKNYAFLLTLAFFLNMVGFASQAFGFYPNFDNHPHFDDTMKVAMQPHLLPLNHPTKKALDLIFSSGRVTENADTLRAAGFEILHRMHASHIVVARHPALPGYLLKLYLDSNLQTRNGVPSWRWLTNRCEGVVPIQTFIKRKKMRFFSAPKKWIYPLPPLNNGEAALHPILLVVTDMDIVDSHTSKHAWAALVTKKHLKELHYILSRGYGSCFLHSNVRYTKSGKFAFIDTEFVKRKHTLEKVKGYIDPKLHDYWDKLCQ